MGYSKIVNGFLAGKGPAHGERKMRRIMFVSSLDSRGDGAGRDGQILFSLSPYPPTETIIISTTTDMGTYRQGL